RTQGGRDIPSKRGVSVTCRWKSAATSGGTTTSRNSDDNSLACPMRQRFNRTGVWATTITAQNALSRCLLQQLLHFRPIVGRRLAGRSGAEIGRGLAVFGRKRFREGLDGTGCREHHFVRLVNGVRSANECASVGRTGIAGDDHALRLFEGKVERKEHVRDGLRYFLKALGKQAQTLVGGGAVILAVREGGKLEQGEDGHGVRGRLGAVVILLHAKDEIRAASRALPEAAFLLVVKPGQHGIREVDGELQVLRLERDLVKFQDAREKAGISF